MILYEYENFRKSVVSLPRGRSLLRALSVERKPRPTPHTDGEYLSRTRDGRNTGNHSIPPSTSLSTSPLSGGLLRFSLSPLPLLLSPPVSPGASCITICLCGRGGASPHASVCRCATPAAAVPVGLLCRCCYRCSALYTWSMNHIKDHISDILCIHIDK